MQVALGKVFAESQGVRPEEISPKVSGQQAPRQIFLRAYAGNKIHGHFSHLPEISARVNLVLPLKGMNKQRALSCVFPSVQLRIKACKSGHMDTRGEQRIQREL